MPAWRRPSRRPGPVALRDFLRYFGGLPHGDGNWGNDVREQLAERLTTGGVWLEAETVLRGLEQSPQESQRRVAVARLAQLLTRAGRPDERRNSFRVCKRSGPTPFVSTERPAGNLRKRCCAMIKSLNRQLPTRAWPTGAVETTTNERPTPPTQYFPAELQGNSRSHGDGLHRRTHSRSPVDPWPRRQRSAPLACRPERSHRTIAELDQSSGAASAVRSDTW